MEPQDAFPIENLDIPASYVICLKHGAQALP